MVEGSESKSQVVLPRDSDELLKFLDGQNSIKDIVSKLYASKGQISFHSVITAIRLLEEAKLLEGVDQNLKTDIEEKSPHEQKQSVLTRPWVEIKLLGKVSLKWKNDWAFFLACFSLLGIICLNYDAFINLNFSRFLKSPTGYDEAIPRIVIISSILISLKSLIQGALLLLSVGTFYGPYFHLYPFTLALGINDNSIYSHAKKSVIITYGIASGLLYFAAYALLELFPGARLYRNDIALIAAMLTFIELNPYRRSDLTKLFYFFYAENQLKNILPYMQNCTLSGLWQESGAKLADEIRYITYTVLALTWAMAFSLFGLEVVIKTFPGLFYQTQLGSVESKYSAILVMAGLLFITGYLLIDLLHTLTKNILSPVFISLMKLKKSAKELKTSENMLQDLTQKLKKNMLFNEFSEEAIDFLVHHSSVRSSKAGSPLILQGDEGRDVYFIIEGHVDVQVRENTGRIKHIINLGVNSIIGEMAVLQGGKRSANVIASTDIVYLEMPESVFNALKEHEKFSNDFNKLKGRIEISQFVSSAELFKAFPPEVMNIFVEAGDLVLFPAGHNIVDEGEKDKTFYLLIKGSVEVYKNDHKVADLKQGDFFGEIALIANVPRTATVKTVEDSLFLYIEDKQFWKILSRNLELAMYIESVGHRRMKDAA